MAIISANQDRTTEAYIRKNPIRSSISAIGYGTVSAINTAVNTIDLVNDVTIIAKETLKVSIIEAKADAMEAELESLDRIESLKAQLEAKKAELLKNTKA